MAPRERRKSFDRINSNNGQEGAQFNNEAFSNDDQPQQVDPRPNLERDQAASPMRRIRHVISIMTLQRNSNPEIPAAIPSPSARRFQPADEPERRFERAVNMPPRRFEAAPESRNPQQEDQANITLDAQPPQPESSERPQRRRPYISSLMPQHPNDFWLVHVAIVAILGGVLLYFCYMHWMDGTSPSTEL